MKIKTEIDIAIVTKAVLREGKLSLSVAATAPYGERTATVAIEQFSPEVVAAVQNALEAAQDEAVNAAVAKAQLAASEAHIIAVKREEM